MDCIFQMCSYDEIELSNETEAAKRRYLKLISCVKLDNRFDNLNKLDTPHFICEPLPLPPRDVLERLIRRNCRYKQFLVHALNQGKEINPMTKINSIDYL